MDRGERWREKEEVKGEGMWRRETWREGRGGGRGEVEGVRSVYGGRGGRGRGEVGERRGSERWRERRGAGRGDMKGMERWRGGAREWKGGWIEGEVEGGEK